MCKSLGIFVDTHFLLKKKLWRSESKKKTFVGEKGWKNLFFLPGISIPLASDSDRWSLST